MKTIITALAFALAVPAASIAITAPAHAEQLSAEAARFGELYVPAELGTEAALAAFDKEFYGSMNAEPQVVAMDKQFPGLIKAAGDAARAELISAMETGLPRVQANMGSFVQARLTPAELAQVNSFLASPSGQRVLANIAGNANTDALSAKMRADKDAKLTGGDLEAMVDASAIASLSAEDKAALFVFSATPGGRKMNALSGALGEKVAAEMNAITESMKPKIEAAVTNAIITHVSKPAG